MSDVENDGLSRISASSGSTRAELKPILLDLRKRTKKSSRSKDVETPRYSSGLADLQRLERDVIRLTQKGAKAMTKGVETYDRERDRSASQKKDGAVKDFVYNAAKGSSAFFKDASDLPVDLAEMVVTPDYHKRMRKLLRRSSRTIRMWRI